MTFARVSVSRAQNSLYPQVNSLYPQVSAETKAMGGAGVSFVSDNALATIANPAELGLFSLDRIFSASYTPTVPDERNAFAVSTGLILNRFLPDLPFKLGFGIGYSQPHYFYIAPAPGPELIWNTDAANSLTLGVGLDDVVRLGLGYTFKWVTSSNVFAEPYYRSTFAPDFGAILQIPMLKLISSLTRSDILTYSNTSPFLAATVGYAKRNTAELSAIDAFVPTEADLGLNVEVGLHTRINHRNWNLLSLTWVRQVDGALLSDYHSLGNFQVYGNLVAGRLTGNVEVLKGWQIQLGSLIYIRGGSVMAGQLSSYYYGIGYGIEDFKTFGWGIRLNGLINLLSTADLLGPQTGVASFVLHHFDIEFDRSTETGLPPVWPLGWTIRGRPMESITIVLR